MVYASQAEAAIYFEKACETLPNNLQIIRKQLPAKNHGIGLLISNIAHKRVLFDQLRISKATRQRVFIIGAGNVR